MEAGPSVEVFGETAVDPGEALVNDIIQEYTWLTGVKERLDKLSPEGVILVYNRSGELEAIDFETFYFRLADLTDRIEEELPVNLQPTMEDKINCMKLRKVPLFSVLIIVNKPMRDFIQQVFLGYYRDMLMPEDLEIIQYLIVNQGITTKLTMKMLFGLYAIWEDLPRLASVNAMKPQSQWNLKRFGSTPELKKLFNAVLPGFIVDNYRLPDWVLIVDTSRNSTAEQNFQPTLNNRKEVSMYKSRLIKFCDLEITKHKAMGGEITSSTIIEDLTLPYIQAAAGLSITTQYLALLQKLRLNLERQANFMQQAMSSGELKQTLPSEPKLLAHKVQMLRSIENDYQLICAHPQLVTKQFLRSVIERSRLPIDLPSDLSKISKQEICRMIVDQTRLLKQELRARAKAAADVGPAIAYQPGGTIVRSLIRAPEFATVREEPQYVPSEYQDLYTFCSEPNEVSKSVLLRLARSMGATDLLLVESTALTNDQICQRLVRHAEISLGGREPIPPQVRTPV